MVERELTLAHTVREYAPSPRLTSVRPQQRLTLRPHKLSTFSVFPPPSLSPERKRADEDLIRYAHPQRDVWVHVDKCVPFFLPLPFSSFLPSTPSPPSRSRRLTRRLSSPHIYIRRPESETWEWDQIPEKVLIDAGQLVKAGSIQVRFSSFSFCRGRMS